MQNADEALPSIILVSRGIFVRIVLTLEPHVVFELNFAYLSLVRLTRLEYAKC